MSSHGDPFARGVVASVRIRWDYIAECVVEDGAAGLFDTTWTYYHAPSAPYLQWWLIKYPGAEPEYLQSNQVPVLVQVAALVTE